MSNMESYTGKALWVNKWIPVFNKRFIITHAPKHLLAGSDTLLIDDKDQNIEEFVAAGGQGILVPRPWNRLHEQAGETLQVVKSKLEEF
jgi:5'(3')-deoxyribonucleotidase